jgi:hypothetical protein
MKGKQSRERRRGKKGNPYEIPEGDNQRQEEAAGEANAQDEEEERKRIEAQPGYNFISDGKKFNGYLLFLKLAVGFFFACNLLFNLIFLGIQHGQVNNRILIMKIGEFGRLHGELTNYVDFLFCSAGISSIIMIVITLGYCKGFYNNLSWLEHFAADRMPVVKSSMARRMIVWALYAIYDIGIIWTVLSGCGVESILPWPKRGEVFAGVRTGEDSVRLFMGVVKCSFLSIVVIAEKVLDGKLERESTEYFKLMELLQAKEEKKEDGEEHQKME